MSSLELVLTPSTAQQSSLPAPLVGGAGQDTFLISTLSQAAIYGGSAADSVNITGSLMGATVDFGAATKTSLSPLALPFPQSLVVQVTTHS